MMDIYKYIENQKMISQMREENKKFLEDIQEEAINKCPFKINDVIKGREIGDKIRAVEIRELKASIKEDGTFSYVAFGFPRNLDGTYQRNNHATRKIYIDDKTSKIVQ